MVPETSFHGQPLSEKGFHEASGKALKDQKLRRNFKRAMNGLMQPLMMAWAGRTGRRDDGDDDDGDEMMMLKGPPE